MREIFAQGELAQIRWQRVSFDRLRTNGDWSQGGGSPHPREGYAPPYSQNATERHSMLSRIFASAKLESRKAVCGQRQVTEWSLS